MPRNFVLGSKDTATELKNVFTISDTLITKNFGPLNFGPTNFGR